MTTSLKSKIVQPVVGDVIRALDFAGNMDYYLIALVTDIQEDMLTCRAISKVTEGNSKKVDFKFTTPVEGAMFTDASFPGRITVLC